VLAQAVPTHKAEAPQLPQPGDEEWVDMCDEGDYAPDDMPAPQALPVLAELVAKLRRVAAFRKRTVALRLLLKERAARWLDEQVEFPRGFEEREAYHHTMVAVAQAMVPDDLELLSLQHAECPQAQERVALANAPHDGGQALWRPSRAPAHPDLRWLATSWWMPRKLQLLFHALDVFSAAITARASHIGRAALPIK